MQKDPIERYCLLIQDMEFRVRKLCEFINNMMSEHYVANFRGEDMSNYPRGYLNDFSIESI